MQILVDADACPVIETVEKIAKEHCVPVTLLCDFFVVVTWDSLLFFCQFAFFLNYRH